MLGARSLPVSGRRRRILRLFDGYDRHSRLSDQKIARSHSLGVCRERVRSCRERRGVCQRGGVRQVFRLAARLQLVVDDGRRGARTADLHQDKRADGLLGALRHEGGGRQILAVLLPDGVFRRLQVLYRSGESGSRHGTLSVLRPHRLFRRRLAQSQRHRPADRLR